MYIILCTCMMYVSELLVIIVYVYTSIYVYMYVFISCAPRVLPFLGRRKAALYCFYFHRKCPERPERCQYIYIYIYICVNNMADAKSVQNLSAIFR